MAYKFLKVLTYFYISLAAISIFTLFLIPHHGIWYKEVFFSIADIGFYLQLGYLNYIFLAVLFTSTIVYSAKREWLKARIASLGAIGALLVILYFFAGMSV